MKQSAASALSYRTPLALRLYTSSVVHPSLSHPTSSKPTINTQHDALDLAVHGLLGLAGFCTEVSALIPPPNYLTLTFSSSNLTVSFSSSILDNCAYNGTVRDLTFTTADVPSVFQCFTLEDLFSSDTTVIDQPHTIPHTPVDNFTWSISNANFYSAKVDYTKVWYHQQNGTSPSPGKNADRLFSVYSGFDCNQNGSHPNKVYPILSWTCQSSAEGDCYEAPYPIMSFGVGSAEDINARQKCLVRWTGSAAKGLGSGTTAAAVGAVVMLMAGVLSW